MRNRSWVQVLVAVWMSACGDAEKVGPNSTLFGEGEEPGGVNPAVTPTCVPLTESLGGAYRPGANDQWPACISDDGEYHPIDPNISAVARVQVFEEMGALLFDPDRDASRADFLAARKLYDEDEGLGSRVERRYDPHYEPIGDADCSKASDVEANPDYCAGPAKILRIVQTAFKNGYEGKEPRWHAGRLEGALLWFFAISEYKESLSCATENIRDCDSAYGYYDGAGMGIGLGRYIRAVDNDANSKARAGALAVRCWRDVDQAVPARDKELQERAREQFDRPVLRGSIRILLDRIASAEKASGEAQRYHWGFVTAFLGAIQSQAYRASGAASVLARARTAESPEDVDLTKLTATLEALSVCGG